MHNKGRKNLHKYLIQASSADEVTSSHAYGRVAKSHKPIPKRRLSPEPSRGSVASYRDSMVGSIAQYHDRPSAHADKSTIQKDVKQDQDVVGNRPISGTADAPKADAAAERRHHFIEPPKRNFHKFD